MKIIKDYLDSLFLTVPITPETQKAKEDLLAIMEDHYHELIADGKSEHEAIGAVISEFGSIDELLAELELEKEAFEETERADTFDAVTIDEAFDFWAVTRKFALELSLGILCCCLAVSSIVVASYGIFGIAAVFGLFIFAAVGIGFIISGSMKYVHAKKKLEDRPLAREVTREANYQSAGYDKSFRFGLILGIMLCVFAIPLIVFFMDYFGAPELGVSAFFGSVGLGVFLIVYTSIIRNGFKKMADGNFFISDTDNPGPRATRDTYGEAAPIMIALKKYYWPLVFVVYFIWSTRTQTWGYSWIIFILAGFIDSAITESLKRHK